MLESANLCDLLDPGDRKVLRARIGKLTGGAADPFTAEHRFMQSDGTAVWVRTSLSVIPADRNSPGRLLALCENLSKAKRAEQIARDNEALAVVGRLTASITHEINNPLESIVNLHYLALLTKDPEESRGYVEKAAAETERVTQITHQTLRFQRKTLQPVVSRPGDLVETVLDLFRARLKRHRIELRFEQEDSPRCHCLEGEIRQVLANLVSNAADAMPEGGVLKVRVRPRTLWRHEVPGVCITVADNGAGIHPDVRKRIFEPFYTTKGAMGSGIGLWLSAEIVGRHRGHLKMRSSTTPGRSGTAFLLGLPAHNSSAELTAMSA